MIIQDVIILTVWHKLAYWPVGDWVIMAVLSPGGGSDGALLEIAEVLHKGEPRIGTKN